MNSKYCLSGVLFLLVALAVVCTAYAQVGYAVPPSTCKSPDMWERMISARWVSTPPFAIDTLYIEREQVWRDFVRRFKRQDARFYRFPDFLRSWSDEGKPNRFPVSLTHWNLNTDSGMIGEWEQRRTVVRSAVGAPDNKHHLYTDQMVLLIETRRLQIVLGPCALEPNGNFVLDAQVGPVSYRYYASAGTYLPYKVLETERGLTTEHRLSAYVSTAGVNLPSRHWLRFENLGAADYTVRYEINPRFDESVIQGPPAIEAGRDAWRVWQRK